MALPTPVSKAADMEARKQARERWAAQDNAQKESMAKAREAITNKEAMARAAMEKLQRRIQERLAKAQPL